MSPRDGSAQRQVLVGQSLPRFEDVALLAGRARFADDMPLAPGTLHAAFVRSPHAHAEVLGIDSSRAEALPGVHCVLTGAEAAAWSHPFIVGVKQPMEHRCLALERVRYVGEPVAIVIAANRYLAEDAADLVAVDYRPLPALTDPLAALADGETLLHPAVGSNVVSDRRFRYGDPEAAFAAAERTIEIDVAYPRNAVTPIEGFCVLAEHLAGEGGYDVLANFQGPFAIHSVMALALKVPGNRLRLRTPPESGGSFGVKQGIFPYVVALCLAARKAGRPVKWVEDRLEHLVAATSATNRHTRLRAAVRADGRVEALDWDQIEDCGGYLRAPEPATLYRMHGNMTGAYDIRHVAIRNRVVMTNKTPSGLVRGFGGPQAYFALERLMQRIARTLGLDPLDVLRRNAVPRTAFPYRTATGGLLDSADYERALREVEARGLYVDLLRRRAAARAEGRLYGVGLAAVVEPSVSNMGYITTVLTADERRKAGPKGGAVATASVQVDPLGSVTVQVASTHQGQGHRTVLAQVVAEVLGLDPAGIAVRVELDTGKDPWSVASGNYSSRFAAAVAGAAHQAALRLRERLAVLAAPQLDCAPEAVVFSGGRLSSRDEPARSLPFHRIAATSHWAQATRPGEEAPVIRETAFWSPPQLTPPSEADEINSSLAHGLVLDLCGLEVERTTGRLRIDRFISLHDAGRLLNPALVDGQIRGAFSNAVGAALLEEFRYGPDGSFLSGTFADYPVPTACEVPTPEILHLETLSPFTPLGAKGVGEGNCMSTPVCLANAFADALDLEDVRLPLTLDRVAGYLFPAEPSPPAAAAGPAADLALRRPDRAMTGDGEALVPASPEQLWSVLLDPAHMAAVIPGCEGLECRGPDSYAGRVRLGVGLVRGGFDLAVTLSDLDAPRALRLTGEARGALGVAEGEGIVLLDPVPEGTRLRYRYAADLSGRVASVGGRMLEGAARVLIGEFFARLSARAAPRAAVPGARPGLLARLLRRIGWRR